MLTGKLPFAGSSLIETLKKQINELLPDPRIEHAEISEECIILLEIMLAKNRADRHRDYQALRTDIARVIAGERPARRELPPGESVLQRATAVLAQRRARPGSAGSRPASAKTSGQPGKAMKLGFGVILGLAAIYGLVLLARGLWRKEQPALSAGVPPAIAALTSAPTASGMAARPAITAAPAVDEARDKFSARCRETLQYAREHPQDFKKVQELLTELAPESQGTQWAEQIADACKRIEAARQQAAQQALATLKADIQAWLAKNNFDGAHQRLETGLQQLAEEPALKAEEISAARVLIEQEIEARRAAGAEARALRITSANASLEKLTQELAGDLLLKDNAATLNQRLHAAQSDTNLIPIRIQITALGNLARQAAGWPAQAARSLAENRGTQIKVEFNNGKKELIMVTAFNGDRISAKRPLKSGYVDAFFSINELSSSEIIKRLGNRQDTATKIMRGLVWVQCASNWAAAIPKFEQGGTLGAALIRQAPPTGTQAAKPTDEPAKTVAAAAVKRGDAQTAQSAKPVPSNIIPKKPSEQKEKQALKALSEILELAGVTDDLSDVQAVADIIKAKKFPYKLGIKIREDASDFIKRYDQTEKLKQYIKIINALRNADIILPPPGGARQGPPGAHRRW